MISKRSDHFVCLCICASDKLNIHFLKVFFTQNAGNSFYCCSPDVKIYWHIRVPCFVHHLYTPKKPFDSQCFIL